MKVTPRTEAEVQSEGLLPEGIYDFEIIAAEEKTSKSGNDMIELKVNVFTDDGRPRTIFDYLLEMDGMNYKLRHAAVNCGMEEQYISGNLSAVDFVGRTGKAKVRIQKGKDGYPDRNQIADYLEPHKPERKTLPGTATANLAEELNDEVPFALVFAAALTGLSPLLHGAGQWLV
jgi:hypothetical protein